MKGGGGIPAVPLAERFFRLSLTGRQRVSRESLRVLSVFVLDYKHKQSNQSVVVQVVLKSAEEDDLFQRQVHHSAEESNNAAAVSEIVYLSDCSVCWNVVRLKHKRYLWYLAKQGDFTAQRLLKKNRPTAILLCGRKSWQTSWFPLRGVLEQNQEVQKPAQFMLQRVEKESWQQDKPGGKSRGK